MNIAYRRKIKKIKKNKWQCQILDFVIKNFGVKVWIATYFLAAPSSRLRHQNFTVPKTRLWNLNLQCEV